jgi:ribosomal protein L12E/L44/L45/RPP1/RPP2
MAKRKDVSVKVDPEAVRIAKIVAAYRDQSLAEYLSAIVMERAVKDLAAEQARHGSPQRPGDRDGGRG